MPDITVSATVHSFMQAADAAAAFTVIKQAASETVTGVVELATTAEAVTGTDTARAVTPAGLTARLAAPGAIGGTTPATSIAALDLDVFAAASATPSGRTVQVGDSSRAGTDTNVGGGNATIASGTGTGTGTASSIIFQTPSTSGSGTGAQTLATRLTLGQGGATVTGSLDLTNNLNVGASSYISWTGTKAKLHCPADGKVLITPDLATTGVRLDVTTDGALKVRNFADNADGAISAGAGTFSGAVQVASFGLGLTPIGAQACGADLTNNATVGGVNNTIATITTSVNQASSGSDQVDLTSVPNKSDVENKFSEFNNNIYQLARSVKIIQDALRDFGLLT